MYVSSKARQQASLQSFREKLSGHGKKTEPAKILSDYGVDATKFDANAPGDFSIYFRDLHAEFEALNAISEGRDSPNSTQAANEESITGRGQKSIQTVRRAMGGQKIPSADRAEKVISRSSTSAAFKPEGERTEKQVMLSFHQSAISPKNNRNPNVKGVNAVQMVMENVLDWDYHIHHHGDTFTPEVFITLVTSLKSNIHAACPSVKDDELLNLFEELAVNNWMGDFMNVGTRTQGVIRAYLDAQNDNPDFMNYMKNDLKKLIRFKSIFYSDVQHQGKVPLRVIARALDK